MQLKFGMARGIFTDEPALKMWDEILQSGRRMTAIASSDSHRPTTPIGEPATHVAANVLSQAALLDAIRRGSVYLTRAVGRPVVRFEAQATGKRGPRWIVGDEISLNATDKIRLFITTEATSPQAMISLASNGQVTRRFPAKTDGQPQVIEN